MKKFQYILVAIISLLVVSCASLKSTTTLAKGNDLPKCKYVVFGNDDEGDAELEYKAIKKRIE